MPDPATDADTVFVLNGPNLNLLGTREPAIYGVDTLADIVAMLDTRATALGLTLDHRQSNHEGDLIDWLHEAQATRARAVILNPGGYTHTSVALRDAVAAIAVPVWEVHLTDPAAREAFRHHSFIADVAAGRIAGHGAEGYLMALDAIAAA
jgi:3-dehydroquinate dehydratase-2